MYNVYWNDNFWTCFGHKGTAENFADYCRKRKGGTWDVRFEGHHYEVVR